jgi:2-keto-4-pentenoate hydratase/2-oxohepta-3-ene-1,7-dioic acid hydratase in catechol pathway
MRLLSYRDRDGMTWGSVSDAGISALGRAAAFAATPTLADALRRFELDELAGLARQVVPSLSTAEVEFLPVVPRPGKVLCVGLNYREHVAETGREAPAYPLLFTRFAASQVGHAQALIRPAASKKFDYEGELAVVIGREGRHVPRARAFDLVAGYACFNDGSVRDWQRHSTHFTPGKNFVATGSFGPWLVTRDEIPDPAGLTLRTRLNGREVQQASVADLVFDVPALIEYISTFTLLEPGDVIVTGTPGGVGAYREPPLWLVPGDVLEVEIDRIGVLRNPVVDEQPAAL